MMPPFKYLPATVFLGLLTTTHTFAQSDKPQPNPNYNAQLAQQLGADQYGMKSYVFVTLKTGPNDDKITDKAKRGELFGGHFANMKRLAKQGKLLLSGPFVEDRPNRGLLIFNVKTLEEAEDLVKTDPAVEAGIFVYTLSKFYGSAALMQVNSIANTLRKNK